MGITRYNYEGKEVGALKNLVSAVVVLEDEWIEAAQQHFAVSGYSALLHFSKALVRRGCAEELSDAQAWMLLHHITNAGAPLALRSSELDEKSRPAKITANVAGFGLGMVDSALNSASKAASGVTSMVSPKSVNKPDELETQE